MSLIIPEQVMTVQFTPQRWGKDTRAYRKAPSDQTGPHAKGRGNYECLYEALTAHLKSITCPCWASLLFFSFFFCTLTFCVLLCHLHPCEQDRFLFSSLHRLTSMCRDQKRVLLPNLSFPEAENPTHLCEFSPRLLLKVCKLPPLHPRGMDWTIRGRGSLVIQGMARERQPLRKHDLARLSLEPFITQMDEAYALAQTATVRFCPYIYTLPYPLECASITW